jgi:hypothetical protein
MADNRVVVEMTGEEAKLLKSLENAATAFAGVDGSIAKITASARAAAKEEEQLATAAKRVYDETRTPAEQHNARMERLNALLKSGKLDQETYGRAAKMAGDELAAAGEKGHKAFGPEALGMVKTFAGALGIGTGLAGAIAMIKHEWKAVIETQKRALEATLPMADAQARFRGAAGFKDLAEAEEADKKIEEISQATGVKGVDLYKDAAAAMKNRFGQDKGKAMEAVGVAAELFPADPEQRAAFAQSILSVQQSTGMQGRQAAGWMLGSAQRSGMSAEAVPKILAAAPDEDPRLMMALAQGIGTSIRGDPTKALLSLMQEVNKIGIPQAGETFESKLAFTQAHPSFAEDVMAGIKLKKPEAKAALAQILGRKGPAWTSFQEAQAAGIDPEEAAAVLGQQRGIMQGGPQQATAAFARRLGAGREAIESAPEMQTQARIAAMAKEFGPIMKDLGEPAFFTGMEELGARLSGDQLGGFENQLRQKQTRLRSSEFDVLGSGERIGPASPEALAQADKLDQVIDALKQVRAAVEANKPPARPTLAAVNERN